jgi:3-deoxy-D-manno-octulosonic-acid transferase
MLRQLDWIACQSDAHCARFAELGADAARIEVVGNVKFDAAAPADLGARAATMRGHFGLGDAPVWVGASTHAGEDEILLDAHARLCVEFPTLRLLLVPRHPERFDAVAALAARRGFAVARRSDARPEPGARVLIGDSMGELMTFYAMSRVAFVGGSLVEAGGHNPIEGALAGVPMLIGPHVDNFEDVVGAFRAAGVLACVRTCDALVASVRQRLLDAAFANREVDTARGVVAAHRGVTERIVERLAERLAERPAERPAERLAERLAGPTY